MITILAYRFSAFGDVAMTVPVVTEFLEQNPDVQIVFVTRKNFSDLFEGVPNLIFKGVNIESGPQRHLPDNHITYSAGIVSLFLI